MSKGSTLRPFSVSNEEYAARWDMIFQRDIPKDIQIVRTLPTSLIEGIMSTETCGHPFCECVDVCREAK